jgi:hypothetical protein
MMALTALWIWMTQGVSTAIAEPAKGDAPAQSPAQPPGSVPEGEPAHQMTDINDIKPIVDLGGDWQWLLYLIGGIIILIGLLAPAWWLWKRRKKPETMLPKAPPMAPDAEAYDALDALAAENGLDPKQFYFRLSAVLRHYMERRYAFPAAEMTTEELLPQVDQLTLEASLVQELKAFCRMVDPIKFAGAAAQHERLAQDLAFTRDFVRQTTEMLEVSEEEIEQ